jgi:hypothetical protein
MCNWISMQSYPMRDPLFITCINPAYLTDYSRLSKGISMCISSLSIEIFTIYPMQYPSISNGLFMPIQQNIQTYPKGYPVYPIGLQQTELQWQLVLGFGHGRRWVGQGGQAVGKAQEGRHRLLGKRQPYGHSARPRKR